MREVFTTFLRLGSTSFGGPIAHLAYFRRTFVVERRWLDEATYARIVAFCSVLPGPTSSQVGMLIGLTRGGPLGALLAWLGFTAPSALAMTAFAAALGGAEQHAWLAPWFGGLLAGLFAAAAAVVTQAVVGLAASLCTDLPTKIIAVATLFLTLALRPFPGLQWVSIALGGAEQHAWLAPWFGGLLAGLFAAAAAVVTQAVVGLAASLCTDLPTKIIAVATLFLTLALRPFPGLQWASIALGALAGALLLHAPGLRAEALPIRVPRRVAIAAACVFVVLVATTALPKTHAVAFLATLIRAGSLVFGGGHVVLPLLQSMVHDGLISSQNFFAGYGAVQAMPGPLNTFSAFLGYANLSPLHGVAGALVAIVLIFLPSFALIFAIAPIWNRVAGEPRAAGAVRGANAAVVGLLGAVLYDPVLRSLGTSPVRIAIAVAAFAAIAAWDVAPWIVVVAAALLGAVLGA